MQANRRARAGRGRGAGRGPWGRGRRGGLGGTRHLFVQLCESYRQAYLFYNFILLVFCLGSGEGVKGVAFLLTIIQFERRVWGG